MNRLEIQRPVRHIDTDRDEEQKVETGQTPVWHAQGFDHSLADAGMMGVIDCTSAF